jgi:hypothetical protein
MCQEQYMDLVLWVWITDLLYRVVKVPADLRLRSSEIILLT